MRASLVGRLALRPVYWKGKPIKASDLTHIPDPHTRMVQATRFLRWLEITQREVTELRDEAMRQCVDEHKETQLSIAETLGLANQRVSQIMKRARAKHEATSAPFTDG